VRTALPEDTTVEGLRNRLAARGLPLRLVPAESTRGPARVAWLTETAAGPRRKKWDGTGPRAPL
jgi:hypothetical protein